VRDLLGLEAAREQPHDLGLAIGQTGGPLDSGDGLASGGKHRGDRFGVEAPGAHLLAERLCGLLGCKRLAVGARLAHGVVGVGRRQYPRGRRERRGRRPAVVARAVESLVAGGRDRGELG
jgi:hypothetical protein